MQKSLACQEAEYHQTMAEPKRLRLDPEAEAAEGDGPGDENPLLPQIAKIDELQVQLDKINDEASDRVLEVEREFNKKRRPVFKQRNEVIRAIPRFWSQALGHHPVIRGMMTEHDSDVLDFCTELDVEDEEDIKSGFKITFVFAPDNPFFSEQKLVKEFRYGEDGALEIKGVVPTWAEGMEPINEEEEEELIGLKRDRPSEGRHYRFMMWFVEYEKLEPGNHDELADLIKEDIWPNPLKYYNGEVDPGEELDMEDDEGAIMLGDEGYEGEDAEGVEFEEEEEEGLEEEEAGAEGEEPGEGEEPAEGDE